MKTLSHSVKDASTPGPGPADRRSLVDGAPLAPGRRLSEGKTVLDLLYAGVVIAVFAVLLLAVRGLDRL